VKFWLLVLPLLLAGCATDDTPEAQCKRQAYDDPAVRQAYTDSISAYNQAGRDKLAVALRQATLECLQKRGLAPPGGVQPVERSYYLF
jgi:hypothetical protein